jgi:hypothetical protein
MPGPRPSRSPQLLGAVRCQQAHRDRRPRSRAKGSVSTYRPRRVSSLVLSQRLCDSTTRLPVTRSASRPSVQEPASETSPISARPANGQRDGPMRASPSCDTAVARSEAASMYRLKILRSSIRSATARSWEGANTRLESRPFKAAGSRNRRRLRCRPRVIASLFVARPPSPPTALRRASPRRGFGWFARAPG